MPGTTEDIIATCELCGFQLARPFPSFELADDSRCPQCRHDLVPIPPPDYPDDLSLTQLLRQGWQIDQVPRDFVAGVLEKAFKQGLDSIDLRISFPNRYEDEAIIEVLSVK
jgi:hypothetical protein